MKSPFYERLAAQVASLGGYFNAHVHLDRANTLDDGFVDHGRVRVLESSHISLQKKHALIATVHEGPAYDRDNLAQRIRSTLDHMVAANTRRVDTMVDVTDDRVGTEALSLMQEIARDDAARIDLRAAAYTPLGFRDDKPAQWDVFERGVSQADFIGSLPEADDTNDYPNNIGFDEHCARIHALGKASGKMIHVHTDQLNIPTEDGTERLIASHRKHGALAMADGGPQVWAVHAISPSTYEGRRWEAYVEGLLDTNIGVICCPSAAIGMRQLRSVSTPTYNSIPRLLELAVAGVPVRLASDNIADMCSPSTTADLTDEVFILSASLRFYHVETLAKLACGVTLDEADKARIAEHLEANDAEIDKLVSRWSH